MKRLQSSLLLLSFFTLFFACAHAQVQDAWVSTGLGYISSSPNDPGLVVDASGNVIAGVNASDFAPGDMPGFVSIFSLTKYKADGTLVFDIVESAQVYNKDLVDIAVDNAGNIYCAVFEWRSIDPVTATIGGLFAVYKYEPDGDVAWKRSYGDGQLNIPKAIAVDAAGNVYLTGSCKVSGAQITDELPDYLTVKWNSSGTPQWARRYDGASPGEGFNTANAIAVDGSGNVYVTGGSQRDGQIGYATIKYNSAGTEVWAQRYNGLGTGDDRALAIRLDVSGFVYVTGNSEGAMATIKYNNDGAQIWVQREGSGGGEGRAIEVDGSGNVFVAGNSSSAQMVLLKLNFAGTKQWANTRSGRGLALDIDVYGNSYISGTSNNDAILLKLNSAGTQHWIKTYDSPLSSGIMNPVAVDALQNVYAIRFISSHRDGNANPYYSVHLLKYTQCDLVCPQDISINTAPGQCTAVVNYNVGITGECGNVAYSQPSGTSLPVGTTIVAVVSLVTGEHCSFNVTVTDNEKPVAKCKNVTLQLDANGSATLTAAQVDNGSTDNCGIQSISLSKTTFSCSDPSSNSVTLTVTDVNGNSASCTAVVTLVDNIPPVAQCKNITVALNAAGTATITANQTDNGSTDACGIKSYSVSKSTFNCSNTGTNQVTLTVTDNNNNAATCTATVTVIDDIKPAITNISLSATVLYPPNLKMRDVAVNYSVSDNCPGVTSTLIVSSNEPQTGLTPPDPAPDWVVVNNHHVQLRAQRDPIGAGRVYTITITATDAVGNTSIATQTVEVPRSINYAKMPEPELVLPPIESALHVSAYPNPTKASFTIHVKSNNSKEKISGQVYDQNSRLLDVHLVQAGAVLRLGEFYRPGIYFLRITQGKEHREIKLIKL